MTQEDKQLLLKDLCARLPYGVKVNFRSKIEVLREVHIYQSAQTIVGESGVLYDVDMPNAKPYLRPMSSMTEEELNELNSKHGSIAYFFIQKPPYYHGLQAQHSDIGSIKLSEFSEIYDWLNAHHIDYRGLIEKGLAIEAPEGMYSTQY